MTDTPYALRLSLTRACSLRCVYCHEPPTPSAISDAAPLDVDRLMDLLEAVAQEAPLEKIRITGGEPLLVPNLHEFVRRLHARLPRAELCLTTNGLDLAAQAAALKHAGLSRLTVSLDAASPDRYAQVTGRDGFARVLAGLEAAAASGFTRMGLNCVLLRTLNGDALPDLVRLARRYDAEARFIELMPVGPARSLFHEEHLSVDEALTRLRETYPRVRELGSRSTARRVRLEGPEGAAEIGLISPITAPFCATCNRLRLDSFGRFYTCLRQQDGYDLAGPLKAGNRRELTKRIRDALGAKHPLTDWPDRAMQNLGG